jgi:hypothetical protein
MWIAGFSTSEKILFFTPEKRAPCLNAAPTNIICEISTPFCSFFKGGFA